MRNTAIVWIIVLAVIAGGAYFYFTRDSATVDSGSNNNSQTKTYSNSTLGVSFQYPSNYVLEERNTGNAEREQRTIVLMDAQAAANIPQNGEGPTAITIDFFQNDLDNDTPEEWIKNSNPSNYKLSPDGTLTPTQVDGAPAFAYTWDGLYRGNSIVFEHKDNIVMMSVTFMTPEDQILNDFATVVASMQLQ